MKIKEKIAIFWFRRDLRLIDNAGLYHALRSSYSVLPIFIFDTNILEKLADKSDRRVDFIHQAIENLQSQLSKLESCILVKKGNPIEIFNELIVEYDIAEVYTNHDYEAYGITRDKLIGEFLNGNGIAFYTFKDQVIFEKNEVLSGSKTPYTIFTPYSRKWKTTLNAFYFQSFPNEKYFQNFLKFGNSSLLNLKEIGFQKTEIVFSQPEIKDDLILNYDEKRDFPAIAGTSRLSVHLRFGTVSIRKLVQRINLALDPSSVESDFKCVLGSDSVEKGNEGAIVFLNELIWRDFYFNITHHFPHINEGKAFKPHYDRIEWRNNEAEFEKWCQGKTGYPIVDAGMRELNETGFMHNRVRMITASFLVKHLLIDWRWGEAYFAQKLLDFDFSANNGGWQWAASSGCDAVPYFRIFNPTTQTERFDKNLIYIKKWIPELNSFEYPQPIVEHTFARERVLRVYKEALEKK